jgi:long-chain acyl-CoA synthetase
MENLHLSHLVAKQTKKYGDKIALRYRDEETKHWIPISWHQFEEQVKMASKSLYDNGLKEQQGIGIFSQNKPECLIVDFALYANRAISIPMYATSTVQQIEYIVNDAKISAIFVGEQYQYDFALGVMKNSEYLKKIVVFDNQVALQNENSFYYTDFLKQGASSTSDSAVNQRLANAVETDIATIMYTSGTTGEPKGVVIPHSCYVEALRIHDIRLDFIKDTYTSLSFLPLTHIFERTWCYFCLHRGVRIDINLRPTQVQEAIKETHPNMMCAVPRFWEKVFAGIQENLETFSPVMLGIVAWSIAVGKKYNIKYLREEKRPPLFLSIKYQIADKLIFSKLKRRLGIEHATLFPTAGAALANDITEFFRCIGVPIICGYGLTESTATVCCFDRTHYQFGSVGKIMPDIQVKLGEDNEILLKGKTIFREYYNKPQATEQAFTPNGWFRTGDSGEIRNQNIFLTERLKDLFKTSNGKYIAPQQIETKLIVDKYIEQVAVIGDQRNFVTAIIFPTMPQVKEYANSQHIQYETDEDLLQNAIIYQLIEKRVKEAQQGMASYEQIKKFILIHKAFSIEAGELTNTLKIRRAVVSQKYKKQIDEMYQK